MKLSEMKYVRPNMDEYKTDYVKVLKDFDQATSAEEQIEVIERANILHKDFNTMMDLSYINFSIDTTQRKIYSHQHNKLSLSKHCCWPWYFFFSLLCQLFKQRQWQVQLFNRNEFPINKKVTYITGKLVNCAISRHVRLFVGVILEGKI